MTNVLSTPPTDFWYPRGAARAYQEDLDRAGDRLFLRDGFRDARWVRDAIWLEHRAAAGDVWLSKAGPGLRHDTAKRFRVTVHDAAILEDSEPIESAGAHVVQRRQAIEASCALR